MSNPNISQSPESSESSISGIIPAPAFNELPLDDLWIQGDRAYEEYNTRNDPEALEFAIQSYRLAMEMTEDNSPEKASTLINLALSLHARFQHAGELRDLEEAIHLGKLADTLTSNDSPSKPSRLFNLASTVFSRFEREGRPEDLNETIELQARAVKLLPDGNELKSRLLDALGLSYSTRFEHSGGLDNLEKSISLTTRAIELAADSHPEKPSWLTNLGSSYVRRFGRLGDLDDLEKAIALHRQSVDLTPDGHPLKPGYLNNIGISLFMRFERLGNLEDISSAIALNTSAIELTSDSNPDKPFWLNNLANSLGRRYEWTRSLMDLEQAVAHQTHAIELTPDGHPSMPSQLNNLGTILQTRFEHSRNPDDLDAAITHLTHAVDLTPETHPDKHGRLYNLSKFLRERFDQGGRPTDLDDAIKYISHSVKLLPEDHFRRGQNLRSLGLRFLSRLRSPYHSHTNDTNDASHAMKAFLEAMQHPASPPLERLQASVQYTWLLTDFPHLFSTPPLLSVLESYKQALDLIPQCIWLGNSMRGRYTSEELKVVGTAVNDAVTAAIVAGEYGRALEWLETGRAVVWSQVLQLRTPVDDLQRLHPGLADDLRSISQALRHAESSAIPAQTKTISAEPCPLTDHHSSHSYALDYGKLIAHIRTLKGFENFLQPKTLSQIANACIDGPVVVINAHLTRCDALVLCNTGGVIHVPLPGFALLHAVDLQNLLWKFLGHTGLLSRWRSDMMPVQDELDLEDEKRGLKPRGMNKKVPDVMRQLLATLWTKVVKPIIDTVRTLKPSSAQPNGVLPHVTWCPTGPFAFLPLHAAGIYPPDLDDPTSLQTASDYIVSSYTTTLEALLKPRIKSTARGSGYPQTLIVSQPNTPGYKTIHGTVNEARVVASRLDASAVSTLNGTNGTVNAVIEGMASHNWVHLACHGIQDRRDSLNSAFALYDGRLTLEMLMSKNLPNADLAVLSACQTATGDEKLPEEAVHLTAGMLNIGFKSVIGTMWSIYDSSAPVVMDEFYRVMVEQVKAGGELRPAYALHEATKALRTQYGASDFVRWVPFVHYGL